MPFDPLTAKFPASQAHVDAKTAFRRLHLAKSYIQLTRAFWDVAFPKRSSHMDVDLLLVVMAVGIGDGDGRPFNMTNISHFTGIPRTTVQRKLEELIRLGKISRRGNIYRYAPNGMHPDSRDLLQKAVERLCATK